MSRTCVPRGERKSNIIIDIMRWEPPVPDVPAIYYKLCEAVKKRNIKVIDELLKINAVSERLSYAQKLVHNIFDNARGDLEQQASVIEILQVLLNHGAKVNFKDDEGHRMLHLAVQNRMTQVIDFLISRNANLDVRDSSGNAILHFTIESEFWKFEKYNKGGVTENQAFVKEVQQSISFIEWMISKRLAFIDCKNENGYTVLHMAAKFQLLHALPTLLKYTRDVTICNGSHMTVFAVFVKSITCEKCAEQVFEKFLEKGFSIDVVDDSENTPIHYALKGHQLSLAKMILNNLENIDVPDADGNTALNIIMDYDQDNSEQSNRDDEEVVRMLLFKGADVHKLNKDGFSPLINAVRNKKLNILKILLEHGVDLRHFYGQGNLLHYFVMSKTEMDLVTRQEVFDLLVDRGCDVNAKDDRGFSPLHLAVKYGHSEIAKGLIESGANVNCRDFIHGYHPLHIAILHNQTNLLKLLVENGADVNAKNNKGQTALHLYCKEDATKKLIELGAHVDVMDNNGVLPLQTAMIRRNRSTVIELLKFGADINDIDTSECTADNTIIPDHVVKLRKARLPMNEELRSYQNVTDHIVDTSEKCETEVEKLKDYKISDTASLYDVLGANRQSTCTYAKNRKFKKLVSHPVTLERQFPMYCVLILGFYHTAVARQKMLEPAKDALHKLANVRLPELCLHEIFGYLNNVYLRSMIEAVKDI